MAKWEPHVIRSGPLRGQYFVGQMDYMNARSRYLGFTSYAAERKAKLNPVFSVVQERARDKGQTRAQAIATAQRIVGDLRVDLSRAGTYPLGQHPQGQRMHEVIKTVYDEGLWAPDESASEDLFGSE